MVGHYQHVRDGENTKGGIIGELFSRPVQVESEGEGDDEGEEMGVEVTVTGATTSLNTCMQHDGHNANGGRPCCCHQPSHHNSKTHTPLNFHQYSHASYVHSLVGRVVVHQVTEVCRHSSETSSPCPLPPGFETDRQTDG